MCLQTPICLRGVLTGESCPKTFHCKQRPPVNLPQPRLRTLDKYGTGIEHSARSREARCKNRRSRGKWAGGLTRGLPALAPGEERQVEVPSCAASGKHRWE